MLKSVRAFFAGCVPLAAALVLAAGCDQGFDGSAPKVVPEKGGQECGNGTCEVGENCQTCPDDCGACVGICGDGTCGEHETCELCPEDCGACPRCGDGTCQASESCSTCAEDCGDCPAPNLADVSFHMVLSVDSATCECGSDGGVCGCNAKLCLQNTDDFVSVKNTGDLPVEGAFEVNIGISQAGHTSTTNGTLLSMGTPIAPGATMTWKAPFCIDLYEIEGYDFTVVVVADDTSQIVESDENDNKASVVFSGGVAAYP